MDTNKVTNIEQNKQNMIQSIPQQSEDKAVDVADFLADLENNYFVIKGVFTGKYSLITGLLELIASMGTGELHRVRLVGSLNKDYRRDTPLELEWDSFANYVTDSLLNKKQLTNSFTQTLNDHFKRICTQEFNSQLCELINTEQLDEVEKNLRREIHKAIREDVKLEIQLQIIDLPNLSAGEATERIKNDTGDQTQNISVNDFAIYLHTELIVDPLNGKTIVDLKQGETVYAYIKERTKSGVYFAQLLGALNDGELLPVKAKINRIEKVPNDTYGRFFTEVVFGPGVAGRSIISSEIKIAVFEPVITDNGLQIDAENETTVPENAKTKDPGNQIANSGEVAVQEDDSVPKKLNPAFFNIIVISFVITIIFVLWNLLR